MFESFQNIYLKLKKLINYLSYRLLLKNEEPYYEEPYYQELPEDEIKSILF
jgi:hypothetical protein